MARWIIIIWLGILLQTNYSASERKKPTQKQCGKVDAKIALINSQLRQGYGLKQGEKLKSRLRKLKKLRFQCKKYRLKTK